MGREIDERVVEMRFDNRQFESEAKQTMGTLDRLKKKLNFDGNDKSIRNVKNSLNGMQFGGLENSLDIINKRFSLLGMTAVQTASRIADRFIASGERIVKQFTLEPITTGFQEYETQMGAIQTILSNTSHNGTTLDEVNAALQELNTYSDKTIYNFTQMAKNIGTFTAAGVDLDTSTMSIKGIANLAAVSGSTAQQASTAMYQLSQALAAGRISLMDWNSVVNAGMGGKVFQDALIRTSELLKTGAKNAIKEYGSFRESLTQGKWLTTDVLTETLKQFAGAYQESDLIAQGYTKQQAKDIIKLANTAEAAATDVKTFTQMMDTLKETAQSGWTQTWQLLAGDFEQGKALWTSINNVISNIINAQSEARNDLLGEALTTGWDKLANQGVRNLDLYRDKIKSVAKENGVNIEYMIEKYGSLDMALKEGFKSGELTYEMMGTALHKYTEEVESMSAEELKASGYTDEQVRALQSFNSEIMKGQTIWEKLSWKGIKDTEKYQKIITAVAKDSGVNMDYLIGKYGDMSTAITEGLNSGEIKHEMLTKAVTIYGNELSKMSDKELKAAGYSKEQLEAVRELEKGLKDGSISMEDYVKQMGELGGKFSIKDFFKNIGEKGGRELLLKSFSNIFKGLLTVIKPVQNAFKEIFPAASADSLYDAIKGFEELTRKFKLSEKTSTNLNRTFKGLFSLLKLIAKPFKSLAKLIFPTTKLAGNLGDSLLEVTANLGDFFTNLNKTDDAAKGIETTFDTIFKTIGDAVKWFADAFKSLKDIESPFSKLKIDTDSLEKGSTSLDKFKKSFEDFMDKFSDEKISINNLVKNGGIIGGLILAFKGFSKLESATEPLAEVGGAVKEVAKGVKFFTKGFNEIGETLRSFQKNAKADALLKVSGAILLLAVSLTVLAFVPPERMLTAAAAMAMVIGVLKLLIDAMSNLDFGSAKKPGKFFSELLSTFKQTVKARAMVKVLFSIALTVVAVGGILALLAKQPWQGIIAAAFGISMVMGTIILAIKQLNSVKGFSGKQMVSLILMVGSLAAIAYALAQLSSYSFDSLMGAALSMSIVLGTVVGSMMLLSKVTDLKGFLPAMAFLAIGLGSIAVIAEILANLASKASPDSLIATAVSLSTILGTLAITMGVCALIGAVAPAALVGILALDLLIANMLGVFYLLGDNFMALAPKVIAGITFLKIIGQGLGEFFGSIVNGLISEASKALGPLGTNLSAFWTSASSFFNGVNSLNGDIGSKVLAISGAIIAMTAAELLQGINQFLGVSGSLSTLGSQLSSFMINSLPFFTALAILPKTALDSAGSVAKMILLFTAAEVIQGIGSFFGSSDKSLADFGKELESFAPSIKKFSDDVKGIDATSVEGAAAATEIMTNAAKNLYGTGGVKQWWSGEKDLGAFATQLKDFAPALLIFANKVKGIKVESMAGATEVIQMIIDIANQIPNEGGVISWFKGDNTMSDFGEGMKSLGTALCDFAKAVSSIGEDAYTLTTKAIDMLLKLLGVKPPEEDTLSTFGKDLKGLGSSMGKFYERIAEVDFDRCNYFIGTLQRYKDLALSLQGVDVSTFKTFGDAITSLSNISFGGTQSSESINNTVTAFLGNLGTAFQNNSEPLKTSGTNACTTWLNSFIANPEGFTTATTAVLTALTGQMNSDTAVTMWTTTGTNNVATYLKAIKDKNVDAITTGTWLVNAVLGGIRPSLTNFFRLGANAAQGFISGLNSKLDEVKSAAAQLGNATEEAVKKSLDEHSPSKVMGKVGSFAGLGYVLELKRFVGIAYEESKKIGDATINGVRVGYSNLSRVLNLDDMNSPVIRPTVDLSDVQKSTNSISKMFNRAVKVNGQFASSVSSDINATKATAQRNAEAATKIKGDTNINYYQTNNSPKALSRIDIYRGTKNQLSTMKEVINNA